MTAPPGGVPTPVSSLSDIFCTALWSPNFVQDGPVPTNNQLEASARATAGEKLSSARAPAIRRARAERRRVTRAELPRPPWRGQPLLFWPRNPAQVTQKARTRSATTSATRGSYKQRVVAAVVDHQAVAVAETDLARHGVLGAGDRQVRHGVIGPLVQALEHVAFRQNVATGMARHQPRPRGSGKRACPWKSSAICEGHRPALGRTSAPPGRPCCDRRGECATSSRIDAMSAPELPRDLVHSGTGAYVKEAVCAVVFVRRDAEAA